MKTLTLYHGTSKNKASKIKLEGLKSPRPFDAKWYILTSDFDDAASFAYDEPTVIEFEIPIEENEYWEGYPYLWEGNKEKENSAYKGDFYAAKEIIPAKFIKKITPIKKANRIARVLYVAKAIELTNKIKSLLPQLAKKAQKVYNEWDEENIDEYAAYKLVNGKRTKIASSIDNEAFYHGTTQKFKPGDIVKPPSETSIISEKGRKKNLDKVFFTKDIGSAKIYAGRAKNSLGGVPRVYEIKPIGPVTEINTKKELPFYVQIELK